ncbi:hypothetical protein Glove_20g34 [Diversispora epigaea]|uniref:Uncharacterized protein n=1 Tax=Diversispora epigaea TaxID=1348612 RepID=A0A397JWT4_9GLOM|nr:hypothetical protein Glove_20g34 [Diversispora epigaea]
MHSKIHANISLNAIAENIVKQAYIIADRDSLFKDTYNKTRHYPYTQTTLEFLFEKQNMHSKIHANISLNAIAENIVKQAYIIADRDSLFKDTYNKTRHYPYTQTTLEFLFEKQFPLENNNSMVFVYRANILTQKNLNNINENNIIENEKSNEVEGEQTNVSSLLVAAINNIKN